MFNKAFLCLSAILIFQSIGQTQFLPMISSIKMKATKPIESCHHEEKTPGWCKNGDYRRASKKAQIVTQLLDVLEEAKDPSTAKIYLGYFSFSNRKVLRKLCEKGKTGFSITAFFDQAEAKETKRAYDLFLCQAPGKNNVKIHFLGQKQKQPFIWRLHHNKFLIVDPGLGQANETMWVTFSSGNLSTWGTSINYDQWVTVKTQRQSSFYGQHMCMVKALKNAAATSEDGFNQFTNIDNPRAYSSGLRRCYAESKQVLSTEEALKREGIAAIFVPNVEYRETIKNFVKLTDRFIEKQEVINKSGDKSAKPVFIHGSIQHFLNQSVFAQLRAACRAGVDVKLVMDDDIITGETGIPGANKFYVNNLKPSCIQVRFMSTNAKSSQMMHNKFLSLNGESTFSGSGHFTYAAFRENYENFYITNFADLASDYETLFQKMWKTSLSEDQIKAQSEQ